MGEGLATALRPTMKETRERIMYAGDTRDILSSRVTSAPTVYFGNDPANTWNVIGFDGFGAIKETDSTGNITLFATNNIEDHVTYTNGSTRTYASSNLRSVMNAYKDNKLVENYGYADEGNAINKRTLAWAIYNSVTNKYELDGASNAVSEDNYFWALSAKESNALASAIRTRNTLGGDYWLCSPGVSDEDRYQMKIMNDSGTIREDNDKYSSSGARPAFNLRKSSILFISEATGGKDPGTGGNGTLHPIAAYNGGGWKVTLRVDGKEGSAGDAEASFSAALVGSGKVKAGEQIKVSYNGAKAGDNFGLIDPNRVDHVSAILVKKDTPGVGLYYASVRH